jgi:hypothetical protein
MIEVVWTKQCECKATASGPRLVAGKGEETADGMASFPITWVQMACDKCDMPWLVTEKPVPPNDTSADGWTGQ